MLRKRHLIRRIRHVIRRAVGRAKPMKMSNARPEKFAGVERGFKTMSEPLNPPHVYYPENNKQCHDDGLRKTNW